jgi:hypothetical protein
MSFVLCCDYEDCGRVVDVLPGIGGEPTMPLGWEIDHWPPRHFCSDSCRQKYAMERQGRRHDGERSPQRRQDA